jgi:hypothetical protein
MTQQQNEEKAPDTSPESPVKVEELDEAAEAAAFDENADDVQEVEDAPEKPSEDGEVPEWAVIPSGVKMPAQGASVAFIRIRAKWTTNPTKGDRWCMCAAIGEMEEKLAYTRSRGDQMRTVAELAKATIRVVDGYKADWSGVGTKKGSVSEFWSSIGSKGRHMIRNYYVRTHTVTEEEALDFFAKDFVNVTVT